MLDKIQLEVRESDEIGREYKLPSGIWVPSVTTAIGHCTDKTALNNWKEGVGEEEANRIREESSARGDTVHSNIEGYTERLKENPMAGLISKEFPEYDQSIEYILDPYTKNTEEWHTEICLWWCSDANEDEHDLGFAGRLDLLRGFKVVGNKLTYTIHDYKTKYEDAYDKWKVKRYRDLCLEDYFIQLSAYAAALHQRYGIMVEGGTAEILFPNGKYLSYSKNKYYLNDKWKIFKGYLRKWNEDHK